MKWSERAVGAIVGSAVGETDVLERLANPGRQECSLLAFRSPVRAARCAAANAERWRAGRFDGDRPRPLRVPAGSDPTAMADLSRVRKIIC